MKEKNDKLKPSESQAGNKEENDLDIPGAELDDLQEDIGSEDEENNYYSFSLFRQKNKANKYEMECLN